MSRVPELALPAVGHVFDSHETMVKRRRPKKLADRACFTKLQRNPDVTSFKDALKGQ
jgi:hypothetical protein